MDVLKRNGRFENKIFEMDRMFENKIFCFDVWFLIGVLSYFGVICYGC